MARNNPTDETNLRSDPFTTQFSSPVLRSHIYQARVKNVWGPGLGKVWAH